jgi:hypothetical protein
VQTWLNQAENVLSFAWRGSGMHTFTSEWVRRVLVALGACMCKRWEGGESVEWWTRPPHSRGGEAREEAQ